MEQELQLNDHHKQEYTPLPANESDTALNDILQKVPSTAEILFYKRQNLTINGQWTDWAIEMLKAGYETENLFILAGEDIHCNPFEFKALTDKIFEELHLNEITPFCIFKIYSIYIIKQALQSPDKANISRALYKLEALYIESGYNSAFRDLYSLSNDISELEACGEQWCWSDGSVTNENWHEYVSKYLEQWMNNPIQEHEPDIKEDLSKKIATLHPRKKNIFKKMISFWRKK